MRDDEELQRFLQRRRASTDDGSTGKPLRIEVTNRSGLPIRLACTRKAGGEYLLHFDLDVVDGGADAEATSGGHRKLHPVSAEADRVKDAVCTVVLDLDGPPHHELRHRLPPCADRGPTVVRGASARDDSMDHPDA